MIDSENIVVRVEYSPDINYALWQAGHNSLQSIEVDNLSDEDWRDVVLTLSGDMVSKSEQHVDLMSRGMTLRLDQLRLEPDTDQLRQLTEAVDTSFHLTVTVGVQSVYDHDYPWRLQPFDQWLGLSLAPEVLASFVTPNLPCLSELKVRAASLLEQLTGSSALDDYQTQDPNRVRAQVASLFEAVCREGLVYSTPPASFEQTGQRVRLAPQVLGEKLATCLDLSLLLASLLEACGLHPLIILTKGHAMVGCWLVDKYHNTTTGDDPSLLLKLSADGISEMVLVDAVMMAGTSGAPFEEAVSEAEKRLLASPSDFMLFVDVYRCRLNGIRPLPLKVEGGVLELEGLGHDADRPLEVDTRTTFDSPLPEDETPADRLQIWERKLLDFSMRNNLLNLRLTRKVIPFVSFGIDNLEDQLQAGESIEVLPSPLEKKLAPDEGVVYHSRLHSRELEPLVADGLKQHKLYSYLPADELPTVEKTLYRESRTAMEENGADTLFLAMGLLKWYETEKSVQARFAPLLLLPVRMVRKSGNNYVIRMRDEDITFNTTLMEMLHQQFNINLSCLSPLPKDESGVDVKRILSFIRSGIKDYARWDIVEESMLGLFSFSKFVMWNDIHSNAALMRENPIVDGLLRKQLTLGCNESQPVDMRQTDHQLKPSDMALPVDADSSQLEAVIESAQGRSFILYGPPGTGKSQTITNIISNALFHGKRVLFVAEKMAALQVVQSRMEKIGLGAFCLEMHSNKMTKSHLLGQLKQVLEIGNSYGGLGFDDTSRLLFDKREELNTYVEHLHRRHESGLSLFDCIMRYETVKDQGGEIELTASQLSSVTDQKLSVGCDELEQLDKLFNVTGHPGDNPLRGLVITDPSQTMRQRLATLLPQLSKLLTDIATLTGLPDIRLADLKDWQHLIDVQDYILSNYSPQVLRLSSEQLAAEWQAIREQWWLPRYFAHRSFMKRMAVYRPAITDSEVTLLCQALRDHKSAAQACGIELHQPLNADLVRLCRELPAALSDLSALCSPEFSEDMTMRQLAEKTTLWATGLDGLREWVMWCQRLLRLREVDLGFVADYLLDNRMSGADLALALRKNVYKQMAMSIIDADPALNVFNGQLFDDVANSYRLLTETFKKLTKQKLLRELVKRVPRTLLESLDNPELALLKRWIGNNGRGVTIRRIMEQLPTLVPRLCPCMLMSPISVAQYIDLTNEKFDIVIFDEASQMPTSEAVGAIARGKSLIVVGDPKQMPPTNFFNTNNVDEQDADNDDMESILDDCITLSLPEHYLSWHYRSRHESLIAFSNAMYYDGRLFTFPSVDDRMSKVSFVPVNGVYDHGRTRSNRDEAVAIVREVLRRLMDPEKRKRSIGIVAFSKVQQNLIEDVLIDALANKPELEQLAYDVPEPIFVKNLENVQGDERDVILFSVGYGPDKNGKVSMNFGPLNNQGGERRLNVAVSRARYEMMVFSTLQPEQIDLNRTDAKGVVGLKRFLEFAKSGRMAVTASQMTAAMKPESMVESLANMIRQKGYVVDTKVGRSQFRIDIAVVGKLPAGADADDSLADGTDASGGRHIAEKSRYVLGIMCDGENYYATKTARDREVVQPMVLQGLEWKLMRVWTMDWFLNPKSVEQRIEEALKTCA